MSQEMSDQLRCLVVEDQILIAMSIETYLEDVGIAAQSVGSMAEARAWLEANTADIAIVDFMLKDGPGTGTQPTRHPLHRLFRLSSAREPALRA
ncbi:hypothetical protein [Microvirga sp. P5_D2]